MNGKKMTKKNSSRLFVAGILTAAICLAFSVAATSDTHYSIEIIEVNGGYGYQISHNNHITIFQPFIPAISGKKPFMEKEDAKKVGKLVIEQSGIFVPQYTNIHSFFIHINSNGWLSKEESLYL